MFAQQPLTQTLKYVILPPLLSPRDICMTFALKLASQDILSNAGLVIFLARTVTFHSYKPVGPLYNHSNFTFIIKTWCGEMLQELPSTLEVIQRRLRVKKTQKVVLALQNLVIAFSCLVFSMLLCCPSFLPCPLFPFASNSSVFSIHTSITPPLFVLPLFFGNLPLFISVLFTPSFTCPFAFLGKDERMEGRH